MPTVSGALLFHPGEVYRVTAQASELCRFQGQNLDTADQTELRRGTGYLAFLNSKIMSSTAVDILVTGKVRDPRVFQQVIVACLQLRASQVIRHVIFSGWSDDLKANPPMVEWLRSGGVVIVDNGPSLPVRSCGNYWEQVKTLEGGLASIEDGVHVFKTRTDLLYYGGVDTIAQIVYDNLSRPGGAYGLKQKIWIPSFVAMQPFFMADQCYFGLAEDLRRFLRYDADVEAKGLSIPCFPGSTTHPSAASAEIRFWLQPFLDQFPVLSDYRAVWPLSMNGYSHCMDLQAFNLRSPYFLEFLAVYWTVLNNAFRVSEGRFCIAHAIDEAGKVIVRANAHQNNTEQFIDAAVAVQGNFPISYSSDRGLKLFLEEGTSAFYRDLYVPALARARRHEYTPERLQGYHQYLNELRQRARGTERVALQSASA